MSNSTLDRATSAEASTQVRQGRRTTRTGIAIGVALAALAVPFVVVMTWDGGASPASPKAPVDPAPAYRPGGSVYEQQVPDHTNWALVYGPGGSIYKSQVPSAR